MGGQHNDLVFDDAFALEQLLDQFADCSPITLGISAFRSYWLKILRAGIPRLRVVAAKNADDLGDGLAVAEVDGERDCRQSGGKSHEATFESVDWPTGRILSDVFANTPNSKRLQQLYTPENGRHPDDADPPDAELSVRSSHIVNGNEATDRLKASSSPDRGSRCTPHLRRAATAPVDLMRPLSCQHAATARYAPRHSP